MDPVNKKAGRNLKKICCVPKCDAYYTNNISFHGFPADPKQCKNWRVILGIKEPIENSMLVCSQHFSEDSFYYETTNINERSLKDGVLPSRNLPHRVLKLSKDEYQAFKKKYIETTQTNSKLVIPGDMVNKLLGNEDPAIKKSCNLQVNITSLKQNKKDQTPTASKGRVRKNENTPHLASRNASFNGTNGSALKAQRKEDKTKAQKATPKEIALDNKVLRVSILDTNLKDLQAQYKLWCDSKTSRSGRKIKNKNLPGFNFSIPKLDNTKEFEKFLSNISSTPKTSVSKSTLKRKLSESPTPEDPLEIKESQKQKGASESKIRKVESTKINGTLKGQNLIRNDILQKTPSVILKKEILPRKPEVKILNKVLQKPVEKKKQSVTCLKSIRLVKKEGERLQVKITPPLKRSQSDGLAKASSSQVTTPTLRVYSARRNPLNKLADLAEKVPNKVSPDNRNSNTKNKLDKIKVTPTSKALSEPVKRNGHMPVHQEILYVRQPSNNLGYYLKMPTYRHPCDGKLKYKFQTLVSDMRTLKLPSPAWKIKVIVRQNNVSGVTVTNKADLERSLSFYADRSDYCIKIDNKLAYLLGSPGELCCKNDIEVLLDIIESIDPKNPMILFK